MIFPFNAATARLADRVDGSEAQVVAEVRAQLQKETVDSKDATEAAPREEEQQRQKPQGSEQQERLGSVGAGARGGGTKYSQNYCSAPQNASRGGGGAESRDAAGPIIRSGRSVRPGRLISSAGPRAWGGGSGRSSTGGGALPPAPAPPDRKPS